MAENINLYLTTKFDSENVPISEDVLNNNSRIVNIELIDLNDSEAPTRSIRFNYKNVTGAVIMLSKSEINSIRYAKSWEGAYYQHWYEVTGYRFFNADIVELDLRLAPFLNGWIGSDRSGTGWNFSGIVDRESWKDGDPVNLLPEPFTPVSEPVTKILSDNYPSLASTQADGDFVLSSVNLYSTVDSIKKNEQILINYSSDDKILSYEIQPAEIIGSGTTTFYINSPQWADITPNTWTYSGLGVYRNIGSTILNSLNALGMQGAVLKRWNIPGRYYSKTEVGGDSIDYNGYYVSRLEGANIAVLPINLGDASGIPLGSDTIKNPKTRYYSTVLHILGKVSGEHKALRWYDIANPTNIYTATLGCIVDPSPDGAPYCYSTFYRGSGQYELWTLTSVRGGTWIKPSVVYEGKTGRLLSDFQTAEQITNNNQQITGNAVSGVSKAIGGIVSGDAGGLIGGIGQLAIGTLQGVSNENQIKSANNISKAIYTPTYTPADMSSLAGSINNNFAIYSTHWNNEDLMNFDKFLTRYGWAQNKWLNVNELGDEFTDRGEDFCYIRFNQLDITGTSSNTSGDNYLKTLMTQRLLNGVRFWRS